EQRARYDRGEIDASGAERPEQQFYRHYAEGDRGARYHSSAGYEDFGDASDLFADLFRRRHGGESVPIRGHDASYHLEVAFLDAVRGAKRRITMPDGTVLDLAIPAGARTGTRLRLKGKGAAGFNGGPPGDALVELSVAPDPVFRRDGDDIEVELPISIDEAVLGGRIEVPTVSGRVTMKVPPGSSSGDVLRLKGKGVAAPGRPAGNQHVVLKVVMPDRIDDELKEFMEGWRGRHGYDPRRKKAGKP
ncbi:MAG: J domain-containing protein, partial [Hyphomicrobiaceae bacterium]|nr:J domain-containing protein [Hyphomicrobiaceae bacterium]